MDSWLVLRRNRVLLRQRTKRNHRFPKWFTKTSLVWSFPIKQEILNVSQIGIAFHRICPPIFIQTWLQQYRRRTFFHSAHCSFSSPICFKSVGWRRTMIPGKIFRSFAKFQGIVSVNDFRLPIRLQELLQAPFVFCEKFLFCTETIESIGWSSPAPRLHIDDCFDLHNLHSGLCWSAVIKSPKFSARGTAPPLRHLHGALVILVLWQISQFRSSGKWVSTLCLPKSALLASVGSKDGSWKELACESLRSGTLSSTRFSLNSCSHSGMLEWHKSRRALIPLSLDTVVVR